MKGYTVNRILRSLSIDVKQFGCDMLNHEISGVSTDTRSVREGDVFFALKGDRFDGADYVGKAFDSGACLSIVNDEARNKITFDMPVVFVKNTEEALGTAARDYRSLFSGKVIGITGTNGKTTVKDMIVAVLSTRYAVHGTPGNFNNQIGLPLSVFGIDDTHDCAVLEMGMSASGEIAYLAGIAQPDVGVLLNVGPAHMEFFNSIEDIADAKAELLESLGTGDTAVVNGDDTLIEARLPHCKSRIVKFGIDRPNEYKAEHIMMHPDGCASFDVGQTTVTLGIPGTHNVYNALAAMAVGGIMGIDVPEAASALEMVTAPAMRMERMERDGVLFINDSYNANPVSMKAAAEVLGYTETQQGGRKIAVLGDMLELGVESDNAHREAGKLFARMGVDLLCLVGKSADLYAEGALENGLPQDVVIVCETVEDVLAFVDNVKLPGDVILVKGSRSVGMEKVATGH